MCKSAPDVQKRGHRFPAGRCPDMQPSSRRPRPDSTRGAQPFRVTTDPRPWGRQSETTAMTRASPRPGSPTGQPSRSRLPSVSRDAPSPPTLTSSRMASVRASHIDPDATWSSPQRGPRATGGLLPVFYASDDRPSRCWTSRSRHGIWPAPIIAATPRGAAIALLSIRAGLDRRTMSIANGSRPATGPTSGHPAHRARDGERWSALRFRIPEVAGLSLECRGSAIWRAFPHEPLTKGPPPQPKGD